MEPRRRALLAGISDASSKAGPATGGLFATRLRVGGEEYVVLSEPLPNPEDFGGTLTDAECAIVRLLLEGRSNAAIAQLRLTSPRTVANQVAAIYRKLHVGSRAELAALCYRGPGSHEGSRGSP